LACSPDVPDRGASPGSRLQRQEGREFWPPLPLAVENPQNGSMPTHVKCSQHIGVKRLDIRFVSSSLSL
jgi:hypothetical protein